eukprot:TRINITY_DN21202_c0_g1_i1.p1 TRINITY_DN21202_c0_g1~~TRINITY_DN21202_c0_g1_i1.p1  ORF type:complete len:857 (-),score=275.11 TRINITY_DN21202_c0_g1_i1:14-2584(-)
MHFFSKLGALLDEADGSPLDADEAKGAAEAEAPDAPSADEEEGSEEAAAPALLTEATEASGVASDAASSEQKAHPQMADAAEHFDIAGSDEEVPTPKATENSKSIDIGLGEGADMPRTTMKPNPSETSLIDGWQIEDGRTSGPSSLRSPSPSPAEEPSDTQSGDSQSASATPARGVATTLHDTSLDESGASSSSHVNLREMPTAEAATRSAPDIVQHALSDGPSSSRSGAAADGGVLEEASTVSTSGGGTGTSDEYGRGDDGGHRPSLLLQRSPSSLDAMSVVEEGERSSPSTATATPQRSAGQPAATSSLHAAAVSTAAAEELEALQRQLQAAERQLAGERRSAAEQASIQDAKAEALRQQLASQESAATLAAEAFQKQLDSLRRELAVAKKAAKEEVSKGLEASLQEVREEMEQELSKLLRQKDDQVKELRSALATSEKTRAEQAKEIQRLKGSVDASRTELESLRKDGAGRISEHQTRLDSLSAEHRQQLEDVEKQKESEARMRHELTLSLRGVEERARNEMAHLEAQKTQLELQYATLQAQMQEDQQRYNELSISLGEAQHRIAQLEDSTAFTHDGSQEAEAGRMELLEVRERLRIAEDKLVDAQAVRDMFSKEADMYRAELKVASDERLRAEAELAKAQDRIRELQATVAEGGSDAASAGGGSSKVMEMVQKDFEERMERYRDEVQYLRQKCDEKERRCEQLLAEKSSLAAEFRAMRGTQPGSFALAVAESDLEAGGRGFRAGSIGKERSTTGDRSGVRSLALSAPFWLRSVDEPLRMVVKTLAGFPQARLLFFSYVILLHFWVAFLLQSAVVSGGAASATLDVALPGAAAVSRESAVAAADDASFHASKP